MLSNQCFTEKTQPRSSEDIGIKNTPSSEASKFSLKYCFETRKEFLAPMPQSLYKYTLKTRTPKNRIFSLRKVNA